MEELCYSHSALYIRARLQQAGYIELFHWLRMFVQMGTFWDAKNPPDCFEGVIDIN